MKRIKNTVDEQHVLDILDASYYEREVRRLDETSKPREKNVKGIHNCRIH